MKKRILVLGAGFGGLELCTTLSEAFGDQIELTLIDKNESFVLGYSKLDVMFGRAKPDAVHLPYRRFVKPGVRILRETITAVNPVARRVTTDRGTHEGDFLVIALGADFDFDATPGLAETTEFYSVAGAARLAGILPTFTGGRIVVGICRAPYKCPPAPSEAALMMHDYLAERGIRSACEIALVSPFKIPIPPSPETSQALLGAFAERGIAYHGGAGIRSIDPQRRVATADDGREHPFDLFLGVPVHRAPKVLQDCGLNEKGYVPVQPRTLETHFPDVYALGDCADQGTPKAGVFAEGAAQAVAVALAARLRGQDAPATHAGKGTCYIEFGAGRVGRIDIDFFSNPERPTGIYHVASAARRADKELFGSSRRARWFGL